MRQAFLAATIIAMMTLATTAKSEWCANYRNGSTNCGFQTFQQCMATVSGVGGFCSGSNTSSPGDQVIHRRRATTPPQHAMDRPVHHSARKPAREIAKKDIARRKSSDKNIPKFSPGDDEHVIPAEPD
jgi:hypothetical protein